MIISINAEKAYDRIQNLYMKTTLSKLEVEGNFLNLIKHIYKIPIANIILNCEKLKVFPLLLGTTQGYPLSLLLSTLYWKSCKCNKTKKENKMCIDWEGRNKTGFVCN